MSYQLLVREAGIFGCAGNRAFDSGICRILKKLTEWCEVTEDDLKEAIFGKKIFRPARWWRWTIIATSATRCIFRCLKSFSR